ncbi:MAG TPA: MFS transporter, partial [Rectinemataceae bacterium]|nr:MFS transporter [Rectinemataceae bacterium]
LSASFIWSVNTLFLLKAGLDLFGVFLANAVFTAAMCLFEIPTGVFADTRGRKFSFLMCTVFLFVGTLGYASASWFGGGLLAFCLMSVVLGLGFTFYSGAVEAWVVDELKVEGYQGSLDKLFSRGGMIPAASMVLGSVLGGVLGQVNLSLPYVCRSAALFILFFFALGFMRERGFTPVRGGAQGFWSRAKGIATASAQYGWKVRGVRYLLLEGLSRSSFGIWGFYASQPYLLGKLGDMKAVWLAGAMTAALALSTMAGNSLVGLARRLGGRRTSLLMAAAAISALACLGLSFAGSFVAAFAAILLMTLFQGLFTPVRQAFLNELIPSSQRATVLSFDSLVGDGGAIVGQTGLGWVSKGYGLGAGYLGGSILLAGALPFLLLLRRLGSPADRRADQEAAAAPAPASSGE